jgi:hypothetical protein
MIPNFSYRWRTPDGDVTIFIVDDIKPSIQIFIGKCGSTVAAWAYALAEMTTFALENRSLDEVIDKLSNISSDRVTFSRGVQCKSTAEALAFSLLEYKRAKLNDARTANKASNRTEQDSDLQLSRAE